jgi:hypothetical protein
MNEIIATRLSRALAIASRMEGNQWLSATETQYMRDDEALGNEQEQLAADLIAKGEDQ